MTQNSCCERVFLPSKIFAKSSNFQLSFLRRAPWLYYGISQNLNYRTHHQPLRFMHPGIRIEENRQLGFTSTRWIDWIETQPTRLRRIIAPAFQVLHIQELHQATLSHKITPEPILHSIQTPKKYKMSQYHIKDNMNSFNTTNISVNNVSNNYTVANEKSRNFGLAISTWTPETAPRHSIP